MSAALGRDFLLTELVLQLPSGGKYHRRYNAGAKVQNRSLLDRTDGVVVYSVELLVSGLDLPKGRLKESPGLIIFEIIVEG